MILSVREASADYDMILICIYLLKFHVTNFNFKSCIPDSEGNGTRDQTAAV